MVFKAKLEIRRQETDYNTVICIISLEVSIDSKFNMEILIAKIKIIILRLSIKRTKNILLNQMDKIW